ncbi:MAG: hypothetical protein PF518_16240 [Spirochaetaceae bacterium]|nr:hypothetical protein [Spirochaetaceae bacterium]
MGNPRDVKGLLMIPWIELLFYIGIVFAPENVLHIDYKVENRVYTFNKNIEADYWYPIDDKTQKWKVDGDSVIIEKERRSVPYFFAINAKIAQEAFSRGDLYVIDKGFTLKKEHTRIIVNFDLGLMVENFTVNWTVLDKEL